MTKKPNIILITVDSLRPDHLGYMGYKKNVSPNIDILAKESTVFTRAFATGPITPHSFPSILTSTYPLDYQGPKKIERPRKLISEVLKEQGFTTAAFHSNAFLGEFFGYNQGWDFFEEVEVPTDFPFLKERKLITILKKIFRRVSTRFFPQLFLLLQYLRYRIKGPAANKIKAAFLTQTVKDFISSSTNNSPFFVWVHYMDVHGPYFGQENFQAGPLSLPEYVAGYSPILLPHYPTKKLKKIVKKSIKLTIDLYDRGIEYVDKQIGDLINFLRTRNIYESCIIILTADHGEEFLEHGAGSHWTKLYNELLHVPLLVKIPTSHREIIEKPVSLIDLSSTLCDILNIKRPSSFKGENLFNRSNSPVFHQTGLGKRKSIFSSEVPLIEYCEIENINQCKTAFQFDSWKYILNFDNKEEELYNLSSDPEEQNNLLRSERPEILFQMRNIMNEFLEKNPLLSLVHRSEKF